MSTTKSHCIALTAILLLLCNAGKGQTEKTIKSPTIKSKQQATLTFDLQKVYGMGPAGNSSVGIGSYDSYANSDEIAGYPQLKNKPAGLRDVKEYCYMLDHYQFIWQNYLQGLYTRESFLRQVQTQRWHLKDTASLSRTPIKCAISVLTGYNKFNEMVYVVDANQNSDFGDDVLRAVPSRSQSNFEDESMAVPVLTEYMEGKQVRQENILILPVYDSYAKSSRQEVSFIFPEFRYARFNYKGEPYFICTNAVNSGQQSVYVMPDIPNFNSAAHGSRFSIGQYARVGDDQFGLIKANRNGNKITMAVDNVKDFAQPVITKQVVKSVKAKPAGNPNIISNQIGFKAPEIKGENINTAVKNVSAVSLAAMKGKYVFVDFWGTFCPPCIAEFPYIKKVYQKYDRSKFEVIGVLDERDETVTRNLIDDGKLVWPNIVMGTNSPLFKNYHVYSYPSSYLINPDGIIVAVDLRGEELADKLKSLIKN
ncbi:TlpA disulfide reductase family protein [Mucilaginibacter panaciglaebae]|uniref:Thioredoxin domain-containing protein n=1 Tax=Mucilaginibacter panaciglaebae TaxID=502331 RepID=A0ABP7WLP6_9SPHI